MNCISFESPLAYQLHTIRILKAYELHVFFTGAILEYKVSQVNTSFLDLKLARKINTSKLQVHEKQAKLLNLDPAVPFKANSALQKRVPGFGNDIATSN